MAQHLMMSIIYKYNGSAFEEKRLEVEMPQPEGAMVWQYFKDDNLQKELEVDYDENANVYTILHRENGIDLREEM